jgi:hypothetical protein
VIYDHGKSFFKISGGHPQGDSGEIKYQSWAEVPDSPLRGAD